MCKNNICFEDGSLNLKYFNVKKGHYWSKEENEMLVKGVMEFGAASYKSIREKYFSTWTETEIRLRICKLLKIYKLEDYKDHIFTCKEEIMKEAKKNRQEAEKLDKATKKKYYDRNPTMGDEYGAKVKSKDLVLVGGIHFNANPISEINSEF